MVEITDLDVNLVIMQHARPHSRTFLTDWPHNRLHNRTARSMVAWASSSPYAWRAARTVQITYTKSCSVSLCNLLLFTNMVTSLTTPYGSHSPGVQAPPLLPCGSRTSLQSLETRHSATSLPIVGGTVSLVLHYLRLTRTLFHHALVFARSWRRGSDVDKLSVTICEL